MTSQGNGQNDDYDPRIVLANEQGHPIVPRSTNPTLKSFKGWLEHRFGIALADALNVMLFLLTIVALIISLISLKVAIATKESADASGAEQLKALQAARDSLSAVVTAVRDSNVVLRNSSEVLAAQQQQLERQVQTSNRQLQILQTQWKRQLAQPDIAAELVSSQNPAIVLTNRSQLKPVVQGHYQVILINVDHPVGSSFQIVSTNTTDSGWIRPKGAYAPTTLKFIPVPNEPLQIGQRLFGYMIVDCPDCIAYRVYGVYIKYGQEGYYRELSETEFSSYISLVPAGIEKHIRVFLSLPGLVSLDRR